MTDLVKMLRDYAEMPNEGTDLDPLIDVMRGLAQEAANEIEAQRSRVHALMETIRRIEEERDDAKGRLGLVRFELENEQHLSIHAKSACLKAVSAMGRQLGEAQAKAALDRMALLHGKVPAPAGRNARGGRGTR